MLDEVIEKYKKSARNIIAAYHKYKAYHHQTAQTQLYKNMGTFSYWTLRTTTKSVNNN